MLVAVPAAAVAGGAVVAAGAVGRGVGVAELPQAAAITNNNATKTGIDNLIFRHR